MFPEQDEEEVQGAAEGLYNTCTLLLQEIPEVGLDRVAGVASGGFVRVRSLCSHSLAGLRSIDFANCSKLMG